jgi:hypothetical protein
MTFLMKILQKFLEAFKKANYPKHLRIKGRKKLPTNTFIEDHKLFRSFDEEQLDGSGQLKFENTKFFPDMSCNWSLFSYPEDVRCRENGNPNSGCYSFNVKTARFENTATPIHDPLDSKTHPNYSHVEIRQLEEGESVLSEPPQGRYKKGVAKRKRASWRTNLSFSSNHTIELEVKNTLKKV